MFLSILSNIILLIISLLTIKDAISQDIMEIKTTHAIFLFQTSFNINFFLIVLYSYYINNHISLIYMYNNIVVNWIVAFIIFIFIAVNNENNLVLLSFSYSSAITSSFVIALIIILNMNLPRKQLLVYNNELNHINKPNDDDNFNL